MAALNANRLREAAIHIRRYLRDSIVSGSMQDEQIARELLGSVYLKSGHPKLAVHQYIYAGRHKDAERAAQDLGDTYYDVTELIGSPHQWVAAAALYFAAAQADVITDSQLPAIVDSALHAIDEVTAEARAESFFEPGLGLAAYEFIASVADRLTEPQARRAIEYLAGRVTAEPNSGWTTDKVHVRIMAGIARSQIPLKTTATEQLLGLFEREPHWFGTNESAVLTDNLEITGQRLRELAERTDPRHRDAAALLALHDHQKPSAAQLTEAAKSLQTSTKNSSGSYGFGTSVVGQSLVALHLPVDDRICCIEALLSNARSRFEGAENRCDYHYAAMNLAGDMPEENRVEFFAQAVGLAQNVPISEPDMLHASLGDPLGSMRWNGASDSRPSALRLAARLARTDEEQVLVRDLAIQLATTARSGHGDIARALLILDGHIVNSLIGMLAASGNKELRCAAAIMCVRDSNDEIATRLASDDEPAVRRALAQQINDKNEQFAVAIEVLRKDLRWSVRKPVQDVAALEKPSE